MTTESESSSTLIKKRRVLKNYVKANPVKFTLLFVVGLLCLRVFLWGALNLTGFCWAEKRWLSDEDFKVRYVADWWADGSVERATLMLKEAPDCCEGAANKSLKFYERDLFGRDGGGVTVHIKGKYPNASLSKDKNPPYVMYSMRLDNCGKKVDYVWEDVYSK
jgi:hypothetical protein